MKKENQNEKFEIVRSGYKNGEHQYTITTTKPLTYKEATEILEIVNHALFKNSE